MIIKTTTTTTDSPGQGSKCAENKQQNNTTPNSNVLTIKRNKNFAKKKPNETNEKPPYQQIVDVAQTTDKLSSIIFFITK